MIDICNSYLYIFKMKESMFLVEDLEGSIVYRIIFLEVIPNAM